MQTTSVRENDVITFQNLISNWRDRINNPENSQHIY
jgi:hypothetical protein